MSSGAPATRWSIKIYRPSPALISRASSDSVVTLSKILSSRVAFAIRGLDTVLQKKPHDDGYEGPRVNSRAGFPSVTSRSARFKAVAPRENNPVGRFC